MAELRIRDERFRVELTVGCQDAPAAPKVRGAGRTVRDGDCNIQILHEGVRVLAKGQFGSWMAEIIERFRGHHVPQEETIFYEIVKVTPDAPSMIEPGCFCAFCWPRMLQGRPTALVIGGDPTPETSTRGGSSPN